MNTPELPRIEIQKSSGVWPYEGTITAEQIMGTYRNINQSFAGYFGVNINPGYIRNITVLPLREGDLGSWGLGDKEIQMFPFSLNDDDKASRFPSQSEKRSLAEFQLSSWAGGWQANLAHEMGHALLDQIQDFAPTQKVVNSLAGRGKNRLAHEAFALLAKTTYLASGNLSMVHRQLYGYVQTDPLFLDPYKIMYYPESDNVRGPEAAVFHYIKEKWGLEDLIKIISHTPSPEFCLIYALRFDYYKLRGIETADARFSRFDRWLRKNYAVSVEELSGQAYLWYRDNF